MKPDLDLPRLSAQGQYEERLVNERPRGADLALERFLTVRELATTLGVHENYIYELAARGRLPSYKIGGMRRFRWSEVERWLENQREGELLSSWGGPPNGPH